MTDEQMIEMAEAHFACGCDDCFEGYANFVEEMYWAEVAHGI